MIKLIAAVAANMVIGSTKTNDLLWYFPADLKRFKKLTTENTVIMGRSTYLSIINSKLAKPLPDRLNIVLTRNPDFNPQFEEVLKFNSMAAAIQKAEAKKPGKDIYIIGGGEVYKEGIKHVDILELTEVQAKFDGDVYFPDFDKSNWKELSRIPNIDPKSQIKFDYVTYKRA